MKKLLSVCLFVFTVAHIGHAVYANTLDYANLSQVQAQTDWCIRLIRDTAFSAGTSSAIIYSIWSFKNTKSTVKAAAFVMVSVGCTALYTLFLYFASEEATSLSNALTEIYRPPYSSEEAVFEFMASRKDWSLEEKAAFSRTVATDMYLHRGAAIQVMDENGVIRSYQPSSEVVEQRKMLLHMKKMSAHTAQSLKSGFYACLVILSGSLVVAFCAVVFRSWREKNGGTG